MDLLYEHRLSSPEGRRFESIEAGFGSRGRRPTKKAGALTGPGFPFPCIGLLYQDLTLASASSALGLNALDAASAT